MTTPPARGDPAGQATVFVVVLVPLLLLCAGLVLDGGTALAANVRLYGDADAAARVGAQRLDLAAYRRTGRLRLDGPPAIAAARQMLRARGDTGQVTVAGNRITVTATTSARTELLRLAGLTHVTVHAIGAARPVRGD